MHLQLAQISTPHNPQVAKKDTCPHSPPKKLHPLTPKSKPISSRAKRHNTKNPVVTGKTKKKRKAMRDERLKYLDSLCASRKDYVRAKQLTRATPS